MRKFLTGLLAAGCVAAAVTGCSGSGSAKETSAPETTTEAAAVQKEIAQGILMQIPLDDLMLKHDFTFLWNRGSIFSQEYDAIFRELKTLELNLSS